MNFYSEETYGEHVAGVYDDWYADYDAQAIDTLAALARGGRALELGTGRIVISQKVVITNGNVRLYPVRIRYAWPAELDLMAQLAGLRLRERWSSWRREPFSSESKKHISVYEFQT
jgi:hypothetical protein